MSHEEISDLPMEMIVHILQFLTARTIIGSCIRASKQWEKAIEHLTLSLDLIGLGPKQEFRALSLATSSHLQHVTTLNLFNTKIGIRGFVAIAQSTYMTRLTRLNLGLCDGRDEGCSAIAASRNLEHLTELNLMFNNMKEQACRALAQNSCLTRLRSLNLSDNAILEGGCLALCQSPYLKLEELVLRSNNIGDRACQFIAADSSVSMKNLTLLNLYKNGITRTGAKALATSSNLSHVTEIDLGENPLDLMGVTYIVESQSFHALKSLKLEQANVGDMNCKILAKCKNLEHLTELNLQSNKYIGNFGCKYLAESQVLTKLKILNLAGNSIGNEGCKLLACASCSSNLRELDVTRNDEIDEEGRAALQTGFSNCKLYM
ncbi:hypothetical protein C9374_001137 [Naegleria lovaniensis]|uniref:F-box domain-containing protein n=1 Tax=Naegleria lovaniensis TaxID=51637 RepID=A0AA88GWC4_NAELO|nr:uncharacterized protein C9374_001137 [Naegleria lovaniensis]KAG2387543.1 hypothetical protein C9374_001137 [Naegleria lovaniensis]